MIITPMYVYYLYQIYVINTLSIIITVQTLNILTEPKSQTQDKLIIMIYLFSVVLTEF